MALMKPKIVFSCETSVDVLAEAARLENVDVKIVIIGEYENTELKAQSEEEIADFVPSTIKSPDEVAAIMFSSGTTGMPKGVMHSYKTMFKNILDHYTKNDKTLLSYSSLYWISGTLGVLLTFLNGTTRIIHENFEPDETCKVIEKYKVCVRI